MGFSAKYMKSGCKSKATHRRKNAKPLDMNQPPVIDPADGKGKENTDERLRMISRYQEVLCELLSTIQLELSCLDSPEITRSSSPSSSDADAGAVEDEDENEYEDEDENKNEDEDQYADEDPLIPYTISALDLAASENNLLPYLQTLKHLQLLPFLRTHGRGGAGKHIKKVKERRMSADHRRHGAPGFAKKTRLPRCEFGTRRKLNHPWDDVDRRLCYLHKWVPEKRGERCLRE